MTPVSCDLGLFRLDFARNRMTGPKGEVSLSPLAAQVLQVLAREPGTLVSREALICELWRGDHRIGDPGLSRVVSEIRRAAGDGAREPSLIQTVPRRGYRLVALEPPYVRKARPLDWVALWRMALLSFSVVVGGFTLLLLAVTAARFFR